MPLLRVASVGDMRSISMTSATVLQMKIRVLSCWRTGYTMMCSAACFRPCQISCNWAEVSRNSPQLFSMVMYFACRVLLMQLLLLGRSSVCWNVSCAPSPAACSNTALSKVVAATWLKGSAGSEVSHASQQTTSAGDRSPFLAHIWNSTFAALSWNLPTLCGAR